MPFWRKKHEEPRGDEPSTNVPEAQLPKFVDELFEHSVPELKEKSGRISSQIDSDCAALQNAIHEFSISDAKPEMDYEIQEKAVAMQKSNYAGMLKSAARGEDNSLDGNIYERCLLKLGYAEDIISRTVNVNNKFKSVMYGYRSQFGKIKGRFSELQVHTGELKRIIEETRGAYERYTEIISSIEKIGAVSKRIDVLTGSVSRQEQREESEESAKIRELKESMEKERSSLDNLDSEISRIDVKITGYLSPLSRPARKYDYITKAKRGLSGFISNPAAEITTANDLAKFEEMLDSMSKMIDERKIDEGGNIKGRINEIKHANLMLLLDQARQLEGNRQSVSQRLKEVTLSHSRAVEKLKDIENAKASESATKHTIEMLEAERNAVRSKVCELVFSAYGKRISIV